MVITFGKTTKNKANRLINLLFKLENIIEKSFGKKETTYAIKFDDLEEK